MRLFIPIFLFCFWPLSHSQEAPVWDTNLSGWPDNCKLVEIESTLDGEIQPAIFYSADAAQPRPLVISLHTWSNGFDQYDPLAKECVKKDFNYIHPHFRGPNTNTKACGSEFAIQDIDDAISWAINNSNVDLSEIHVIGVSGGGYATLLSYMKTKQPVKTFSAWVPLSDLIKWYYESEGRASKYSFDIARSTVENNDFTKEHYYLGEEEAKKRSPMYMETPVESRKNSKLSIFTGVHDGYTGSVPITQSLLFFNKLVKDFDPSDSASIIPEKDIIELLSSRGFRAADKDFIADREIHYRKTYKDNIQITVFEGNHEMLTSVALDPVESKKILTIGDSNGAFTEGWVNQLKGLNFNNFIHNTSIPGNTIGFDNNGYQSLNTLRNINNYMDKASESLMGVDKIIIMLGTNDCKVVFEDSLEIVPENMETLIKTIKQHPFYLSEKPEIIIVSPPPIGRDEIMQAKYFGGSKRVAWLYPKFKKIAKKNDCIFIDTYSSFSAVWDTLSKDGIHASPEAQKIIARIIYDSLGD